ncbi:hypothetical protein RRG08_053902 [Elysia crispata]|uniref:Retrotransposon gag domain-containing protein n=1 Tax=Elysia crispata TaxID=231223 RepID=A0AAE0ZN45_9GAST|nr:hypothetical protein RRG08_053902 [Elysia crispata]
MNLPPYEKFDCHSEGTAVRWTRWVRRLEHIFDGYEIAQSKRKYALTLTYGGPDLNDIVESLPNNEQIEASDDPYKDLIDALNDHFNPKSNVEILKYQFRHKTQTPGSKIDDFYAELRQLAAQCKFVNPEDEIKSQIISGCLSRKLREKGLITPIDLTNLLKFARTLEMTEDVLADSGDSTNIISQEDFSKIDPTPKLSQATCKIFSYASSRPLETVGVFDAVIQAPNGLSCKSKVNVIKQTTTPILGWPVCQNLEVLKSTQHVNHLNWTTSSSVVKQYPEHSSKNSSFLRNYRQTPHSTTGQPPSLLMFGRQTRSKLPTTSTTPSHNQQTLYDLTKLTDSFQKQKMKYYADNKNSKPSNINIAPAPHGTPTTPPIAPLRGPQHPPLTEPHHLTKRILRGPQHPLPRHSPHHPAKSILRGSQG